MSAANDNLVVGAMSCAIDDDQRVVRLGANVRASTDISWLPKGTEGWLPLNAYVVLAKGNGVIIDTSLPIIEREIIGQLKALVESEAELAMLITRQVEYESIGNAAAILQNFRVTEARSHDMIKEVPYFHPKWDPPQQGQRGPWWPHRDDDVATENLSIGETLSFGEQRIKVLRAPLRLLATAWLFHENSGTLFSSDSFATGCIAQPTMSPVVEKREWSINYVRAFLTTKFEWVTRANMKPILDEIDRITEELDVRCIAPSHGMIFRNDAATELLSDYRTLLAEYSS